MDFVNLPLLAVSALVFASVLTGLLSARWGLSFLLVFLLAGILAGEDGPGGWLFNDYRLSFWVGTVALAVILLDGGLRTPLATFRTGLKPALWLATLGVLLSAAITAGAGMVLLGLDWRMAALLGAIVGSTDAAAVFSLLSRAGVTLNERVAATLEIESGMNDPMAVYLTLAFITLAAAPALPLGGQLADLSLVLVRQIGLGAVLGCVAGLGMAALLARVAAHDTDGGLLALLLMAGGLSLFALTGWLGGSGFLAVYLFGLLAANRAAEAVKPALAAMDGYAWLAQAGMFLLLGLLVTPSALLPVLVPALGLALVLMLVARPAAVWLCLWPLRFSAREMAFIAWVGLRGAVPIVLALFPLLAGLPQASLLFNVAFVVVLVSLLLQGSTIGWMARQLGVALPEGDDELRQRAVFGDFALDARMPVGPLADFYGLSRPLDADQPLGDWMAQQLHRPPVAGDRVPLGTATLVVRGLQGNRVVDVGLILKN